jgi:hypothetical protein
LLCKVGIWVPDKSGFWMCPEVELSWNQMVLSMWQVPSENQTVFGPVLDTGQTS